MKESFDQQARTEPAVVHRLAAGRAQRRQRDIERPSAQRARASRARKAARTRGAFHCRRGPHGATLALRAGSSIGIRLQRAGDMQADAGPSSSIARCCARAGARACARAGDFLLDRVAEDLAERLARGAAAVRSSRSISARRPTRCGARWPASGKVGTVIAAIAQPRRALDVAADEEALPFRRRLARSRRLRAGAAIRQRSAGHARADPPRAEAGRTVPRGAARRRHADRVAPSLRRGRERDRRRRLAARRARSPICATSARCCSAPALRCR